MNSRVIILLKPWGVECETKDPEAMNASDDTTIETEVGNWNLLDFPLLSKKLMAACEVLKGFSEFSKTFSKDLIKAH